MTDLNKRQAKWQKGYNDGRAGKDKNSKGEYKDAYIKGYHQGCNDLHCAIRISYVTTQWNSMASAMVKI